MPNQNVEKTAMMSGTRSCVMKKYLPQYSIGHGDILFQIRTPRKQKQNVKMKLYVNTPYEIALSPRVCCGVIPMRDLRIAPGLQDCFAGFGTPALEYLPL